MKVSNFKGFSTSSSQQRRILLAMISFLSLMCFLNSNVFAICSYPISNSNESGYLQCGENDKNCPGGSGTECDDGICCWIPDKA
jgi:hypothetical protein